MGVLTPFACGAVGEPQNRRGKPLTWFAGLAFTAAAAVWRQRLLGKACCGRTLQAAVYIKALLGSS